MTGVLCQTQKTEGALQNLHWTGIILKSKARKPSDGLLLCGAEVVKKAR